LSVHLNCSGFTTGSLAESTLLFSLPVVVASVGAEPVQSTEEPVDEFTPSPEDETEWGLEDSERLHLVTPPVGS
jgi:hypothetical protein